MSVPSISSLHAAYCQATGFDLPLRFDRQRAWFEFDKAGFTAEDLRLVVRWIRRQIDRGASGYASGSLRFSTLILRLDEFEEKLLLAQHEMKLRPTRPSTIIQERRDGAVRRQVEISNASDRVPVSAEAEKFMTELRQRQAARKNRFPLPTSEGGNRKEVHEESLDTCRPRG